MVAAVVVLYNPDIRLLDRLLRSIADQVEKIFVIDNTPGSMANLAPSFNEYTDHITYLALGENKGIATAQNVGIGKCIEAGYSHVLLLDQDSALSEDMVKNLLDAESRLIHAGKKVAAVGPLVIDEKTGVVSHAIKHRYLVVERIPIDRSSYESFESDCLIASGSLIRTCILRDVGLMLDELFIDLVDFEWGLRAKSKGYRSYIISSALMWHNIGDAVVHILGRLVYLRSSPRKSYIVRNATYLLRFKTMGWGWRVLMISRIPYYICVYSWCSNERTRSFNLLLRAFLDGITGKLGPIG